jgi:hypothetical protein
MAEEDFMKLVAMKASNYTFGNSSLKNMQLLFWWQ